MRKSILSLSMLAGAFALSSCGKHEEVKEPRIIKDCNGLVCSFAVEDVYLNRYTNMLGKTVDRVVKKDMLKRSQDQLVWVLKNGSLAETDDLLPRGLTPCLDGDCTLTSNPTGWVYNSTGLQEINVSGSIVDRDGTTRQINEDTTVYIEPGTPTITFSRNSTDDLDYSFFVDDSDTGIPDNATYTWSVNGDTVPTEGKDLENYKFDNAGESYDVKLAVTADGMDPITVENIITTGPIAAKVNIDSINGKQVSVSVDNASSALPAGTVFSWSVDGEESITGSGASTTLTMPTYASDYTVKLTAVMPGGTIFTDSKSIYTSYGTPTFDGVAIGGSGTDYRFTANTTGTGLPPSVTYVWKVDGETQSSTTGIMEYDFIQPYKTFTVTMQAKVDGEPVGDLVSETITTGEGDNPSLSSVPKSTDPLIVDMTANLDGTGIDDTWTMSWVVNGSTIAGDHTNTLSHSFALPETSYPIIFTATKNGETRTAQGEITTGPINFTQDMIDIGSVSDLSTTANVDLTGTGIKSSSWTLAWTGSGGVSFGSATDTTTTVTFPSYDQTYDITLTATPPPGSGLSPVSVTTPGITVGPEPGPTSHTYTGMDFITATFEGEQSIKVLVDKLNEKQSAANASFSKVSDTEWKVTCNSGWALPSAAVPLTTGQQTAESINTGQVLVDFFKSNNASSYTITSSSLSQGKMKNFLEINVSSTDVSHYEVSIGCVPEA